MQHSKERLPTPVANTDAQCTPPPQKKLRPNLSVNLKCQGETAGEMQRLNVN